jgi:2-alkenal reductase
MNRTLTRTRIGSLVLLLILLTASACGGRNGAAADSQESIVTTANTANQSAVDEAGSDAGVQTTSAENNARQAPALQQTGADTPSQQLLTQLYEQILPSVVDIQVTATTGQVEAGLFPFFGGQQQPRQVRGEGTGWLYDDQGHIVTNNHVVENATEITVNFSDGSWATGEVVATDPQADLAVVRVTPPDGVAWRPLPVADAATLNAGSWVLAFGTPFGLEGTMTLGIISALGRGFPVGAQAGQATYTLPDVVQTDAAINPGNSGGPLLNLNGEVVGVNFAINSTSGANSGVGFAIPTSVVQRIVPALIQNGAYAYPYLGISGGSVTPQLAAAQNIPANIFGVWVGGLVEDGSAAAAGLQEGDIITAIGDQPVRSFDDLVSYLFNNTTPGQEVTLTFIRGGNQQTATATIQERPAEQPIASSGQSEATLSIGQATEIARQTVLNGGLMESVESSSATLENNNGRAVWVVTLTGDGRTATVAVDAATGNVINLEMQ